MGCSFDGECCSRNCINYVCKDYPMIIPPGGNENDPNAQGATNNAQTNQNPSQNGQTNNNPTNTNQQPQTNTNQPQNQNTNQPTCDPSDPRYPNCRKKKKKLYLTSSRRITDQFGRSVPATKIPFSYSSKSQESDDQSSSAAALFQQATEALSQTTLLLNKIMSSGQTPQMPQTQQTPQMPQTQQTPQMPQTQQTPQMPQNSEVKPFSFVPLVGSPTNISISELSNKLSSQDAKNIVGRLNDSSKKIEVREKMGADNKKRIQIEFEAAKKRKKAKLQMKRGFNRKFAEKRKIVRIKF